MSDYLKHRKSLEAKSRSKSKQSIVYVSSKDSPSTSSLPSKDPDPLASMQESLATFMSYVTSELSSIRDKLFNYLILFQLPLLLRPWGG